MDEKIVLFGAGQRMERMIGLIEKYGGFEVVEIWDNNVRLWGEAVKINGQDVPVRQPHKGAEHNIVIVTDIYYREIEKQLIQVLGIGQWQIKPSNYLLKNFKADILEQYVRSTDKDIQEICEYLQNHELDMFNGQVKKEYSGDMFDIYRDEGNGLLYSYWGTKKIYLASTIKNELIAKEYLCSLCKEQDEDSPHCYGMDLLDMKCSDVVIDGGAAEGFFSLQIIDKVKKVYLIEGDGKWVEALKCTFEPYRHKVEIIPKWLGDRAEEGMVTLDEIGLSDEITVVKLDIEGAEARALEGGKGLFSSDRPMTAIVCTYHETEDAEAFEEYFKEKGFCTRFSKGYLFVDGLDTIKAELRKGVLCAYRE